MKNRYLYFFTTILLFCLQAKIGHATVSFSVSGNCQGEKTKFDNATTWGNKFKWRFGDGSTSTDRNPEHIYSDEGTYNVTLIVSKDTLIDSLTKAIPIYSTVIKPEDIMYSNNFGCVPGGINAWDTSVYTVSRIWDFGDGTTSTDSAVTYYFDSVGYYTVSLSTVTVYGCTRKGTFDSLVSIYPYPKAEFTTNPSNPSSYDKNITFVDKTYPGFFTESENPYTIKWYWELGDGSISQDAIPIHDYELPGEYKIKLIIENNYECIDTVSHTIFISDMSSWYIPSSFTPNGDGKNDEFLPVTHNMETKQFEFNVYDKWGNLVFHSTDVTSPWDGRSFKNQNMLPTGVYTWQMNIIYESGVELNKQGFINLLSSGK